MKQSVIRILLIILFYGLLTNAQSCSGDVYVIENNTNNATLFNITPSGSCWCENYIGNGSQLLLTQNSHLLETINLMNNTINTQNNTINTQTNTINNLNNTINNLMASFAVLEQKVNNITGTGGSSNSSGQLLSFQILTGTNETYVKNSAANSILVECVGGGGGGGGCSGGSGYATGAGGGGAGGYCRKWITNASLTYTYTIGSGGSGSYGINPGIPGNNTTFGSLLTANGGSGGMGMTGTSNQDTIAGLGGNGGSAYGGDINFTGQAGLFGICTYHILSGAGGNSVYGGGAAAVYDNNNGTNATNNSGSGGSGAGCVLNDNTGGNGGAGLIIVWEYS